MPCGCGRPKSPLAAVCVVCRRGVTKPHLGIKNRRRAIAARIELAKRKAA
jgi:hypothetical protein